jgi:hypothetical protein
MELEAMRKFLQDHPEGVVIRLINGERLVVTPGLCLVRGTQRTPARASGGAGHVVSVFRDRRSGVHAARERDAGGGCRAVTAERGWTSEARQTEQVQMMSAGGTVTGGRRGRVRGSWCRWIGERGTGPGRVCKVDGVTRGTK